MPLRMDDAPTTNALLAGGEIQLAGPPGYCIDADSLRNGRSGGFALLASCAALGAEGPSAGMPAVMTVTVSRPVPGQEAPTVDDLRATVAPANVLASREDGALAMVQLDEGGEAAFDGSDARYWRGAKRVGDRIIGLALYAPEGGTLAGDGGAGMLARLAAGITPLPEAASATATRDADRASGSSTGSTETGPGGLGTLFRSLLKT